MPTIVVIINAGSGADSDTSKLKEFLAEVFGANGVQAKIIVADNSSKLVEIAESAALGDYKIVVAGGGDGTISAVAAALVGTNKTLGVLPLGTLNHFSKDLGIPQDLAGAVQIILDGNTAAIDVGEVNGQIFINNSSIGLYPNIVRRRERQQRLGRSKWYAAFWATLAVLRRYPFFAVRLNLEDETVVARTPFVFVGNNEYEMDTLNIGARKCLDAGALSVYLLRRTGRTGLVRLALRSLFGLLRQAKDFDAFRTNQVTIETRSKKTLLVAFDGEVKLMQAPLYYQTRPKALRVLVPKENIEVKG
ncbi:MAG: diacylglycerol kinase family protein [Pyrinomonadaceae bacterium]